jgi:hypothetical protein
MHELVGVMIATLLAQVADNPASFRASVPILAVRVSDDDGSRPAEISPSQLKRWVDRGNQIYAATGIHFLYKTSDGMVERKSTLLNNPTGAGDRDWLQFKRAGKSAGGRKSR